MLPLLPGTFKLGIREKRTEGGCVADPVAVRQLEIIRSLLSQSDTAITATDASREGELAARYIYGYLGFRGEVKRLWITSLTDEAIREGLRCLRPQSDYDSLYRAGKARREADWLAGCNASLSLGFAAGRHNHSLGRVQTPALAMVCRRYQENREYLPKPCYRLRLTTVKNGEAVAFTSTVTYAEKEAEAIRERLAAWHTTRVVSAVKEETAEEPPLLYNLTGLQCEASLRLGFTARQTLAILQNLYERGYVSHPRTASRHIGQEALESMPALLAALKEDPRFARHTEALEGRPLNLHAVDDGKAAGHHALLVTENIPSGLSVGEQAIHSMIAARMLEAFSDCCRREVTDIRLECGDVRFGAQARVTLQEGWTAVRGKGGKTEDTPLPDFQVGETLPVADITVEPVPDDNAPQPFTEAALMAAMEENGLGTPGTRANVIELLISRRYMERRDGHLLPTPKGLEVYGIVKDKLIADTAMTARWEQSLQDIESGKANADAFMEQVRAHTRQIVEELSEIRLEHTGPVRCRCPKCGGETVSLYRKVAACSDPDCAFHLFRLFNGRELTDGELLLLLQGGSTPFLGFTSKKSLPYEASLRMDENYRIEMTFKGSSQPATLR